MGKLLNKLKKGLSKSIEEFPHQKNINKYSKRIDVIDELEHNIRRLGVEVMTLGREDILQSNMKLIRKQILERIVTKLKVLRILTLEEFNFMRVEILTTLRAKLEILEEDRKIFCNK